jgi:hypothetical protein
LPTLALPVPETLPLRPLVRHGKEIGSSHFLADCLDVPPCERRERLRLLLVSLGQCLAILRYGGAAVGADPGVSQDVAALKSGPTAGFMKPEIVREVFAVVSHM